MTEWMLHNEPTMRLGAFFGVFAVVALAEWLRPRRARVASKVWRWLHNVVLVVLNTAIVRLAFPAGAVAMALVAQERGWGLLHNIDVPYAVAVVGAVVALDFAIYLQHVMFHAVPALWRLHMVHHADRDLDVTSGLRFHPVEILLSMVIKIGVVAALGPPAVSVLAFEVILNATAMFNHGNIRIPEGIDRVLRLFVVTPDMHRVHHSVVVRETNSNFGFNVPWWDRLMGTYRRAPAAGQLEMTVGVEQFPEDTHHTVPWMLALPASRRLGAYSMGRDESEDRA
jgi:sterol desaturase/sphingolipid hydroxylase (fatty acid hydroxylase superfamily)